MDADADTDADAGGIAIALLHLSAGALKRRQVNFSSLSDWLWQGTHRLSHLFVRRLCNPVYLAQVFISNDLAVSNARVLCVGWNYVQTEARSKYSLPPVDLSGRGHKHMKMSKLGIPPIFWPSQPLPMNSMTKIQQGYAWSFLFLTNPLLLEQKVL